MLKSKATPPEGLPKKIVDWRERMNLTRFTAAERLGVSYATLINWEQGRYSPRGLALRKLQEIVK